MLRSFRILSLAACLAGSSAPWCAAQGANNQQPAQPTGNLQLKIEGVPEGGMLPREATCDGTDLSPHLSWSGAPSGTKSFALIVQDLDAAGPGGAPWVHWVVYDLPPEPTDLANGIPKVDVLPNGGKQGLCWGRFERTGYNGPCPPLGSQHRYVFRLYALDNMLQPSKKLTGPELETAMAGHILAQTEVTAAYRR